MRIQDFQVAPSRAVRRLEFFPVARLARRKRRTAQRAVPTILVATISLLAAPSLFAQADPASEPAVLAVAKVLPAVVNINTERVVRRRVRDPFEDFAAQYFGNYRSRPREIRQTLQSLGSGFIVDPAGYIVTNEHVVQRAADLKIEVTMNDGKIYNAHYITGDPKKDLAFIKIDAKADFPFINLENISPNLLGQTVLVVGNALGYGSSISRGVLSGMKRDITVDDFEYKDLLQTDAAINPGNSGGPVIDLSGRLVGVSSAKMAFTPQGVPTQGLGFAIPAETVRASVGEFKKTAQNQPPPKSKPTESEAAASHAQRLFGVQLQNLTPGSDQRSRICTRPRRSRERSRARQPRGSRGNRTGPGDLSRGPIQCFVRQAVGRFACASGFRHQCGFHRWYRPREWPRRTSRDCPFNRTLRKRTADETDNADRCCCGDRWEPLSPSVLSASSAVQI